MKRTARSEILRPDAVDFRVLSSDPSDAVDDCCEDDSHQHRRRVRRTRRGSIVAAVIATLLGLGLVASAVSADDMKYLIILLPTSTGCSGFGACPFGTSGFGQ